MQNNPGIPQDILIDKLTRSIENVVTGDSFPTDITLISSADLKNCTPQKGWRFERRAEFSQKERDLYKLTIVNNPTVIQGLISLQVKEDHVFVHLVESAPFNIGKNKMYAGVGGNLVAFACKVSFQRGHDGYVAFYAKTSLIEHYKQSLGASVLSNHLMVIHTQAAIKLINTYFHND
jgi:hypothetical protein